MAWGLINFYIGTQVQNEAKLTEQRLGKQFEKETAHQMALLVFNEEGGIGKAVKIKLDKMAGEQLLYRLENNADTKKILIDAAVKGLTEETATDLLARFKDPKEKNPAKRKLTLQLAFVYATDNHKQALRDATMRTILDEAEDELVRVAALELHQPLGGDRFQDDVKDLKQVLDLFENRLSSVAILNAYGTYFELFGRSCAVRDQVAPRP